MNLFQIEALKAYTEHPDQSDFFSHTHDTCELYCFISGNAAYSVEGNIYPLAPGDIIVSRNAETHHLMLKKSTPYTRITVFFKPDKDLSPELKEAFLTAFQDRPIGLYNRYSAAQFPDSHWLYYLNSICGTDDNIKRQIYLMALLRELTDCFPMVKDNPVEVSPNNMIRVTHFIDRHLTETLNLDLICDRFFISKAQLIRNFKKNLGTTVGDYINTKRLLLARDLILEGHNPTTVYLQCGFRDYSAFFRAYKKKFGCRPGYTKEQPHRDY